MGIDQVYRNGSRQVPPGTDGAALRSLIAREISRHRVNLERTLNARSDCEKDMAQLGIVKRRDPETKALRSDQSRARRRFSWALETLRMLQQGADAATIIDPDTGRPVAAGPPASAVPEPRPAAPPPPRSFFTSTCARVACVATHTTASGGMFGGSEGDVAGGRRGDSEPDGDADRRRARAAANGLNESTGKSTSDRPDPGTGARRPDRFLPILAVVGQATCFPDDPLGSTARSGADSAAPGYERSLSRLEPGVAATGVVPLTDFFRPPLPWLSAQTNLKSL